MRAYVRTVIQACEVAYARTHDRFWHSLRLFSTTSVLPTNVIRIMPLSLPVSALQFSISLSGTTALACPKLTTLLLQLFRRPTPSLNRARCPRACAHVCHPCPYARTHTSRAPVRATILSLPLPLQSSSSRTAPRLPCSPSRRRPSPSSPCAPSKGAIHNLTDEQWYLPKGRKGFLTTPLFHSLILFDASARVSF